MSASPSSVAAISFSVFVIAATVALPMFFWGYRPRFELNTVLVTTVCTVTSHNTPVPVACNKKCACVNVCTTTKSSSGASSTSCHLQCSICPSTCFDTSYVETYMAQGIEYNITEPYENNVADLATAINDLNAHVPVGLRFTCYYLPDTPYKVMDSMYHDTTFLVFTILFAIVAGCGLLVCIGASVLTVCGE